MLFKLLAFTDCVNSCGPFGHCEISRWPLESDNKLNTMPQSKD